MVSALKLAGAG